MSVIKPLISVPLYSTGTFFVILFSFCKAAESQFIQRQFLIGNNCTDDATSDCCPIGSFYDPKFNAQGGRKKCNPCPVGTFCLGTRCTSCSECAAGREAQNLGSASCTECAKGFFKPRLSADLCTPCPAGFFAGKTGQTNCTLCFAKHYCLAGAVEPLRCESYHVCPSGTEVPIECEPPWYTRDKDECVLTTALIVVICVITVPIVVAVIVLIIYKLYKYCKRRRRAELCPGETEPLLFGNRTGSRLLQEPVYTGL